MVDALSSGEVSGILIDAYTAGAEKDILNDPLLHPVAIINYPRWFGLVVSGTLANVEYELNDYVLSHQGEILRILERLTDKMEVSFNVLPN